MKYILLILLIGCTAPKKVVDTNTYWDGKSCICIDSLEYWPQINGLTDTIYKDFNHLILRK